MRVIDCSDAGVETGHGVAVTEFVSLPAQDDARRGQSGFTPKLFYPERDSFCSLRSPVARRARLDISRTQLDQSKGLISLQPRCESLTAISKNNLPSNPAPLFLPLLLRHGWPRRVDTNSNATKAPKGVDEVVRDLTVTGRKAVKLCLWATDVTLPRNTACIVLDNTRL